MTTVHLASGARALMFFMAAGALTIGCSDNHAEGVPTESVCPATQTLTYANFGRAFFDSYCQSCHAGTVTGAARKGAPQDHTFDQIQDIQLLIEHIDEHAAAGPAAVNTLMPPADPRPTEAERRQLGEWLACGAPE
jgi:cytochrome c5